MYIWIMSFMLSSIIHPNKYSQISQDIVLEKLNYNMATKCRLHARCNIKPFVFWRKACLLSIFGFFARLLSILRRLFILTACALWPCLFLAYFVRCLDSECTPEQTSCFLYTREPLYTEQLYIGLFAVYVR